MDAAHDRSAGGRITAGAGEIGRNRARVGALVDDAGRAVGQATDGVWTAAAPGVAANPYVALSPDLAASDAVSFRYSRDTNENNLVDTNEQFGFRLRNHAIEMLLGAGNWQALTDAGTLDITEFNVTPTVQEIDLHGYCTQPCPAASATCPPRQQVRSLALVVTGRSTTDASVTRSLRSNVRLRNDALSGACPS